MKDDTFVVYVPKGVDVYTRDALIWGWKYPLLILHKNVYNYNC
jgi:hypothetical protein